MAWFVGISIVTVAIGFTVSCAGVTLGHLFLREFTRPGVTVEPGTPQWGGWTFPEAVAEPPKDLQRRISFQAADGICLHGEFWAQKHQAPTVIISHGFHLPSRYFRSVAALEYAHGANLLLFDYRGHGQSALTPTTCGNAEIKDLVAAVDLAASQAETLRGRVYIHGFSMGAAIALLLPPHAAVAGIIADSPYARLDEMIRMLIMQILAEQISHWPTPMQVTRLILPALSILMLFGGRLLFYLRYRQSLIARPDQAIGGPLVEQTADPSETLLPPILLIHAEHDPFIMLHHAHRLVTVARTAGRAIRVYYTACAIHCGSYGHDPRQYMARLRQFMGLEGVTTNSTTQ